MSLCTEIPGSPNVIICFSIPRKASATLFVLSLKFDTILIGKMQHDEKKFKKFFFFLVIIKG